MPVADAESAAKVTSFDRKHDKHWEEVCDIDPPYIKVALLSNGNTRPQVIEHKVNNNQPLKENSLLWEVTSLHDHDKQRHDVILSISHAIFDGISSVEFSRDLLEEIAALKKGNATAVGKEIVSNYKLQDLYEC